MTQMEQQLTEPGEIHDRLIKNWCPRCSQRLSVLKKTDMELRRFCKSCDLTVIDKIPGAETPDICD